MNLNEISASRKHVISTSIFNFAKTEECINTLLYTHTQFFPITQLIEHTIQRGTTVNRLARNNHIDDAEIIFRSMLDGFIKIIYILTAESKDEHQKRLTEYFDTLNQIESMRSSDKYKILSEAKINNRINPYASLILSQQEEDLLKQKPSWSNRKYRQELKAKWSYSEISKYLSKNLQGGIFVPFELLDHYYKISSHIAHGDESIFKNKWIDKFMEKHYKQLVKLGNMSKMMRITNELSFWICLELSKFLQQEIIYNNTYDRYEVYLNDIGGLHNDIVEQVYNYGK